MIRHIPPNPDELEVSLFGPGVGECIVVHVGLGEWFVVDSCIDQVSRRAVALEYFEALGVDIGSQIRGVIVTHWHDDHMRGAAQVLDAAKTATFVCSAALRSSEFKEFVAASPSLNMKAEESSGVGEFAAVLAILLTRRAAGIRKERVGPEWALADKLIYRRVASNPIADCEVFALSPASQTLSRGIHEIAELLPRVGVPKRAAVEVDPNETSIVLSVRFGNAIAVLGSDLQNGATSGAGWSAVLSTASRPTTPAQIFKVPHHGSENAHHPDVWQRMLTTRDPVAILTPYARGRKTLPSQDDLARMKALTRRVYCTAPRPPRATVGDSVVQRTINEVACSFRSRGTRMGHIRIRLAANGADPTVELFGAAFVA